MTVIGKALGYQVKHNKKRKEKNKNNKQASIIP